MLLRGRGYAVIAKPAGLACSAERSSATNEVPLLDAASKLLGESDVRFVHRIDKGTSGCLLVATDADAHRFLSREFQDRRVKKAYLALVTGAPPKEGEIDAALEPDPRGGSRMRVARGNERGLNRPRPKESHTRFRTLVRFRQTALVVAEPVTGRQHQIRVHLRHVGHPLRVDPLYGGDPLLLSELKKKYRPSKRRPETPIMSRLTLHAWKLSLATPDGQRLNVRAPLPSDFRRVLRELLRFSR
ncbi:MAG: RluA family pseudouridine synthase [Planctomycetota bacterium]